MMMITRHGLHVHDTRAEQWPDTIPTDFGELQERARRDDSAAWFRRMQQRQARLVRLCVAAAIFAAVYLAQRLSSGGAA